MNRPLIALHQLEHLSECSYALLLGLNTHNNLIERYLNFARKLLGVQHAVLCFQNEPLMWCSNANGLFATPQPQHQLHQHFLGLPLLTAQHPHYSAFSEQIQHMGMSHRRCVAVNLCQSNLDTVAVAVFYDEQTTTIAAQHLELLQDYSGSFMRHIEMKFHFDELNERYEEQCAQNHSKTKFFSIISHDLRAPFHGLLGFSEVLAKERHTLDDSSIQNIADYLYDTAQSTYSLLESLLNWAMAEGGRFVYHPVSFKLKQSSAIVCEVLNSLAIKKHIQLIDDIADDTELYADINMITSLLQNLVSNALKFTATDGRGVVHLSAQKVAGQQVEICIRDNGLGMTEAQIASVFQPQIHVSFKGTAGEKGTGLGLTLCKRFVDLNQGKIQVSSQEGEGTTFRIWLPAAPPQAETVLNTPQTEVFPQTENSI